MCKLFLFSDNSNYDYFLEALSKKIDNTKIIKNIPTDRSNNFSMIIAISNRVSFFKYLIEIRVEKRLFNPVIFIGFSKSLREEIFIVESYSHKYLQLPFNIQTIKERIKESKPIKDEAELDNLIKTPHLDFKDLFSRWTHDLRIPFGEVCSIEEKHQTAIKNYLQLFSTYSERIKNGPEKEDFFKDCETIKTLVQNETDNKLLFKLVNDIYDIKVHLLQFNQSVMS